MSKVRHLLVIVVGLFALVTTASAACGDCSATSYAACINKTAFNFCFDGVTKNDQVGSCETGKVCTTESGVCIAEADATIDCADKCGLCDTAFACVSKTEFVMCDASLEYSTQAMTCPENQYCNIDVYNKGAGRLCVELCSNQPTCSNDVVEQPDPEEEYGKSCEAGADAGVYPNKSDPSCKTYVYCEELNGVMNSFLYTCSGGYFNKATKLCDKTRPSYCTAS